LRWRRAWFEWEKPSFDDFVSKIQSHFPIASREDKWVWKGDNEALYTMKDAYCKVLGEGLGQQEKVYKNSGR